MKKVLISYAFQYKYYKRSQKIRKAQPWAIFTIMPLNKYECDLLSIYLLLILLFGNNADEIYHSGRYAFAFYIIMNIAFN